MNQISEIQSTLAAQGLPAELIRKWQHLVTLLQSLGSAVVAYSGGVDSTFLATVAHQVLGDQMCAVFLQSEVVTEDQTALADQWANLGGFKAVKLFHDVLNDERFVSNPVNRCYVCKLAILGRIQQYAHENGYQHVIEGQNADDLLDYRPGKAAVTETGTKSPLLEAGLTKAEIRTLARALDLPVWNQPSSPCLATRIPYGQKITSADLKRVYQAEKHLHSLGFHEVRVRSHQNMARIEVEPDQRQQALDYADEILVYFKAIGFMQVALDLQGYRRGSLNEGAV